MIFRMKAPRFTHLDAANRTARTPVDGSRKTRAKKAFFVIGGGGHAKVVISSLIARGCRVVAALDADPSKWGGEVLGVPVRSNGRTDAGIAIIAVGCNSEREEIAKTEGWKWGTVVHPAACVDPS